MDRPDRRKPLTRELKGSLITLYNCGYSFSQIANRIGCHVRKNIVLLIGDIHIGEHQKNVSNVCICFLTEKYSCTLGQSVFGFGKLGNSLQ